jgi:hypothetical protein
LSTSSADAKRKTLTLHIDRKPYKTDAESLTGAQLRALPEPDLPTTVDLYLEVPGGDDRLIHDDDTVELRPGMHFFSAPSTINPGRAR